MQEGAFHEVASFWSCRPTWRSSWAPGRLPSYSIPPSAPE